MNKLRMIFENIINFGRKKPGLLIALIGCQMAGILVVLVSVGMLYHFFGVNEDREYEQKYLRIGWVEYYDYNGEDISENNYHAPILRQTLKVGDVRKKFPKLIEGLESNIDMGIAGVTENTNELKCTFDALNLEDQNPQAYTESQGFGQYFTCEQFQGGSNVVTYEKQERDGYKVEDNSIVIAGKKFSIIKGTVPNELIWNSVPDQMQVSDISISFKEPMTNSQVNMLKERIGELFPTAYDVLIPKSPNIWNMQNIYLAGAISLALMVFAVLNLSLLIVFVYQKRQKSIEAMRSCGTSVRCVERMFMIELFMYELLGTVGAYAIFRFVVSPYLSKFYGGFSSLFSVSLYGIVFLSYYIVAFIIIKLRIRNFRKQW